MMRYPAAILCLAVAGCGDTTPTPTPTPTAVASPVATPSAMPSAMPSSDEAAVAAGGRASRYTSLAECRTLEAAPEEAGYRRSRCPGVGGYALDKVDADARGNLFVIAPGGAEQSLSLPAVVGSGFSTLGDRVEWRGAGEPFRPTAIVVRFGVQEKPEGPDTSYLVVAKLAGTPCVIGRIAPGPDQNAQAQALADRGGTCLPGGR